MLGPKGMVTWLICFVVLLFNSSLSLASDFDHQHALWSRILEQHVEVSGGVSRVAYADLARDRRPLERYLEQLEAVTSKQYQEWSESQQLAFLINAYNAFTVKLIVDNYPVKSIKDLGSFFSTPWKKKFFTLLGERRHLDNIEHDMIRQDFKEPRIHFAVNCAATSCPALRRQAFVAGTLEQQLEEASRAFLNDPRRNRFLPEAGRLELSSILKWYGADFRPAYGSIESFVAPRITGDPEQQERIRSGEVRVRFLDYDWSLNDASGG